jgi:hypothetical protein
LSEFPEFVYSEASAFDVGLANAGGGSAKTVQVGGRSALEFRECGVVRV